MLKIQYSINKGLVETPVSEALVRCISKRKDKWRDECLAARLEPKGPWSLDVPKLDITQDLSWMPWDEEWDEGCRSITEEEAAMILFQAS